MSYNSFKSFKNILLLIVVVTILSAILITVFKQTKKIKVQLMPNVQNLEKEIDTINKRYDYKSLPLEKLNQLDVIPPANLLAGQLEMVKRKAVFLGISRDSASELPSVMRHIEYMGEFFQDYQVIIFENDSTDSTKFILKSWEMINPKVRIISQDFSNKKRPSIKFLAEIRNKYLNALQDHKYKNFDIVIPIDMDMGYGIDIRGVLDSFAKIDQWDAVCSNGISNAQGNMYDAFAFRNAEFPDSPNAYKLKTGKEYWDSKHIVEMQKIYPPESDLVPVDSCFGGMALYKKKLFADCYYDSVGDDCEHVYLHQCMRNKHKAKIFMNPSQVIRYIHYTE